MDAIAIRKFLVSESGLSPVICWTLILLDQVMSGLEILTGGFFIVISLMIAVSFGLLAALYQNTACRDEIVPALVKGFICFVIIACPSGFMSILLCPYAVLQTTRHWSGK